MNWMQIDKEIYLLIKISKSRETLYNEVKRKFKWTDSQVEAAVGPLLRRMPDVEKEWSAGSGTIKKVEKGTQKKVKQKRQTRSKKG